jgi:acetylornithine/N-succinyldiaminopimelate aminotransferase
MDWAALEARYLMYKVRRPRPVMVRGEGVWLWDEEGRQYLDFVGGWAVNILGHSPRPVVDTLCRQAAQLMHTSNQFYTVPQILLGERLVSLSCFDKAFFANSGAEANEAAVKLARKYGRVRLGGAYEVITALKSFHGRTLAMVAATGKPQYQEPFRPLPAGFVNVEFNSIDAIRRATSERTCAVMLELVQGEGGVNVANASYIKQVREWCDERGLLLIVDEVQTGMGRTGTLFAYQQYGIEPDLMTLAKGLGAGFPIGALLAKGHADVWDPGDHGTTFGGNPLACSVALTVLDEVERLNIPDRARSMGEHLKRGLEQLRERWPVITEVRGLGLLLGVEFREAVARKVVEHALHEGLLINAVNDNVMRLMPPLVVEREHVELALDVLDTVLRNLVV